LRELNNMKVLRSFHFGTWLSNLHV